MKRNGNNIWKCSSNNQVKKYDFKCLNKSYIFCNFVHIFIFFLKQICITTLEWKPLKNVFMIYDIGLKNCTPVQR